MFVKYKVVFTMFFLFLSTHALADHTMPKGTSEFSTRSENGTSYLLQIDSNPIQTMQAQNATLTLTNTNGDPISGAAISCAMKMPSMAMAKNTPPIKETVQVGTYKSVLLFTMGGDWTANCTATFNNQVSETVVFEINDVPHDEMSSEKHGINKMLGEKDNHNMKEM